MKAMFIHDNKYWISGNTVLSYGHFAYHLLWKRYLKYFDEIVVGGRFYEAGDQEKQTLSITSGENVSFFELPNLSTLRGLFDYHKAEKIISKRMKEVDFVIIRLPSSLGSVACKVAKKLNKNYAVEVVGCAWDALSNHSLKGKLIAPFSTIREKKYVKSAPNVIYVSRHFLQKRYPNGHFNIGCPDTNVICGDLSVLEKRYSKIEQLDLQKEIRVGLIASLKVGYKGHDTAIEAVSYIKDKYPGIKVCFLGDGSPDKWIPMVKKYNVENNIEFCGSLPGGDPVIHWIDNLDVFIMPSLQETLGRALVEAMSRGCPAIGGAGTAVPEQLPDDCIHERKNAKQLADMIDYMLSHKSYMKLCAEENFVRAKKYSEEILEEKRDYFWETAIANRKK